MDNSLGHDLILFLFVVLLFVPLPSLKLLLAQWSMVVIVLKLLWFGRQRRYGGRGHMATSQRKSIWSVYGRSLEWEWF